MQTILQQMQDKFKTMSDQIITRYIFSHSSISTVSTVTASVYLNHYQKPWVLIPLKISLCWVNLLQVTYWSHVMVWLLLSLTAMFTGRDGQSDRWPREEHRGSHDPGGGGWWQVRERVQRDRRPCDSRLFQSCHLIFISSFLITSLLFEWQFYIIIMYQQFSFIRISILLDRKLINSGRNSRTVS